MLRGVNRPGRPDCRPLQHTGECESSCVSSQSVREVHALQRWRRHRGPNGRTRKRNHACRARQAQERCAVVSVVVQHVATVKSPHAVERAAAKADRHVKARRRAREQVLVMQNCLGLKTYARCWILMDSLKRRHVGVAFLQVTWHAGFAVSTQCDSGYTLIEWGPPLQKGCGSACRRCYCARPRRLCSAVEGGR